jgi:hypothetical protein
MTRIEALEREVQQLSAAELASFRSWFTAFDAAIWDQQVQDDVEAGKLDDLADTALADHRVGRSRTL